MLVPLPKNTPRPPAQPWLCWWALPMSPGSGVEFVGTPLKVTPNTPTWVTPAQD